MVRTIRVRYRYCGAVLALLCGLAGCSEALIADPPGPGVPRIADLQLSPERTTVGCPVQLRFRFEDSDGNIARVLVEWSRRKADGGVAVLPVSPEVFSGRTLGEVSAFLVPEQSGVYWYTVQVEGAAGRKSNLLKGAILVDGPVPWAKVPTCR